MGIIGGLYRTGKFAAGSPIGRIMTGAAVGGVAGAMSGDEFSSTNSIINKTMVGAMAGGAIGMGLNRAGLATAATAGVAGLRGARMMGSAALRIGAMPGMIGAGLATAGVGAGIYGYEALAQRSRKQRFQESTTGIVQGMHQGRHRG